MNAKYVKRFFDWINARHLIYIKKSQGEPWPWTKDDILRTYKFTNVFRELDATTIALHDRVDKMAKKESLADRFYRIVLFRAFNWPATYDAIVNKNAEGSKPAMMKVLRDMQKHKLKIFTGAYIITNAGSERPKIEVMSDALSHIYKRREKIVQEVLSANTLEHATTTIKDLPMHGWFTSYEVACDLRYQPKMLNKATDVLTWANPGPGANRGLQRIKTGGLSDKRLSRKECIESMRELLELSPKYVHNYVPTLEMREIEHSLCEFDKYERVRLGEGRPRSIYRPDLGGVEPW